MNLIFITSIQNDCCNSQRWQTGIAMMAVSAVDNALWDLKAKILECFRFVIYWERQKIACLIYGSGGFTSYNKKQTAATVKWVG